MIHVIEDNHYMLNILADILEVFDYSGKFFSNPKEYCDYVSSKNYHKPQIVITDVKMPHMNGFQLMNHVASIHDDIKFIIMTGYDVVENSFSNIPHTYVKKPFNPDDLHIKIQGILNQRLAA